MKTLNHPLILMLLSAVLLSACLPIPYAQPSPTVDLNAINTQVAATLTASAPTASATQAPTQTPWVITATASQTQAPTQTPWIVTATYTNTATPSNTPLVTNTPTKTATPNPTNTPEAACHRAELVAHVTIPQGTFMAPNKKFTKIWRIKNIGTCAWTDDYELVFSAGTNMANKNRFLLESRVNPGSTVDIAIAMRSPTNPGSYTSDWLLRSDNGQSFGLSTSGKTPISFKLLVSSQVNRDLAFDFAADACLASWRSGAGALPCPGSGSGKLGFVIPTLAPNLETRHEDEPGLWMQPDHDEDGYIRGVYPLFEVTSGNHFTAWLGCHGDSPDCNVRFTLSYITQNGAEHEIESWIEKYDGQLTQVHIDLSSLAGKSVRFVLTVEPNNNKFDQADGVWFLPAIREALPD